MARDDDYDDAPRRRRSAPFPGGVKTAGIIWIAVGSLGLLNNVVSLIWSGGSEASGICGIIVALCFLIVGIQTVKGTATGTLGNGIGSIIFGLLWTGVGIVAVIAGFALQGRGAGGFPGGGAGAAAGLGIIVIVMGAIMSLLGLSLLVAGFLAIMGREAYQDWRIGQGLGRKKRRRQEEDDYDDEPRQRRRRPPDDDDDVEPRKRSIRDDDDRPRRPRPEAEGDDAPRKKRPRTDDEDRPRRRRDDDD